MGVVVGGGVGGWVGGGSCAVKSLIHDVIKYVFSY